MGRPSEGWVKRGCSRIRIEQKQKKQRQDVENDSICTGIGQPCVILGGTFIAWHPPTFRRSFVRYLHSLPRQNVVHFDEKGRKITKKQGGFLEHWREAQRAAYFPYAVHGQWCCSKLTHLTKRWNGITRKKKLVHGSQTVCVRYIGSSSKPCLKVSP